MREISYESILNDGVASIDGDTYSIEDVMSALGSAMSPEDILIMEEEGNLLDMMGLDAPEPATTGSESGSDAFESFFK